MLEVGSERLDIIENLLEVLFNHCQNPSQLYVSQTRNNIVSYRVILITNEYWEFDVETFHHGCGLAPDSRLFTEPNLPMRQQTFDKEVETNQKVHQVFMSSLCVLSWKTFLIPL